MVTRSPEVAELACKAGMKTILHSLPGRNDTVRLGSKRCFRNCPALRDASSCPGISRSCGKKASRRWRAISQRWTKKNGPSSGWAFVPRTARSGWEVPFCSEAVISALCCSLPEGKGGGVVIRQHPESVQAVYAARQEELEDADTAEELERLRKFL